MSRLTILQAKLAILIQMAANKHVTKAISQDGATEAAFLAKRRAHTSNLWGTAEAEVVALRRAASLSSWTGSHATESDFNATKLVMRKVDAYLNGGLLPAEVSSELHDMSVEMQHHRSKTLRELEKRDAKIATQLAKRDGQTLVQGKTVFLEPNLGLGKPFVQLGEALRRLGASVVEDPCRAAVWVTRDPANPGQHVRWVSCLLGGSIASQEFVISGGCKGVCFEFSAAVHRSKRLVFATASFREKHDGLLRILEHAVKHPTSKWKFISAAATIEQRMRKEPAWTALVLCLPSERHALNTRYALDKSQFITFFRKASDGDARGMCQR